MPGWILVANRFSLLPTIHKCGFLSFIAPLICLVVLSGCSNIRQHSLELPLPILPSESATATETNSEASASHLLANDNSAESVSAKENSAQNASAFDQAAFKNDFAASDFEQNPSVQSFLPSENDFQQQQPHARFVGLMDKAEMTEIKLIATTDKAAPAPAITKASHEIEIEHPITLEAYDAADQHASGEKKALQKFAVAEPIDAEQLPDLFGHNQTPLASQTIAPPQLALQPLQKPNVLTEPIRLTARQDSATVNTLASSESAQTENKAHQLILIAPAALQALKTEVDQAKSQETPATATSQAIIVSPIMDIDSALAKTSPATARLAGPANLDALSLPRAKAANVTTATTDSAKLIPVSSSGIRVSAIPFQPLPVQLPSPVIAPTEPVVKSASAVSIEIQTPTAASKTKVEPAEITKYFVAPQQTSKVPSNDFAPTLTISTMPIEEAAVEQAAVEQAIPNEVTKQAKQDFPIFAEAVEVVGDASNEFVVPASSADIDPVPDSNELPDMSQIEEELAEFEKFNTFNPSMVIQADTIDPAILLAKLDGPTKSIAAPVPTVKIVETTPNNDLITQQLAAQSSALLQLQDAIEQLKPKPVSASPVASKLSLHNAAFCTKISGFGQFKPFAKNNFSSSQKTLLYCEVENQTSKPFTNVDGSKQYETVLHGSIAIYNANDQIVQTTKFPAIKDVARHQRRDFYVYFPVQFNELARGDYRLELSIEDAAANRSSALQPPIRFSVR